MIWLNVKAIVLENCLRVYFQLPKPGDFRAFSLCSEQHNAGHGPDFSQFLAETRGFMNRVNPRQLLSFCQFAQSSLH
jgi:hypothetical protein